MHDYLVSYHSLEHGWVAAVAKAVSADGARRLVVLEYGAPNARSLPHVVQLDGLPFVVPAAGGRRRGVGAYAAQSS